MNKNNLSQEEFATKLSLDRSYLSRVESGKQNITAEVLIRVCEMGLEVSMGDFFDFSKISFEEKV